MKWLVQTLDSLTSHCPESQATAEQSKLEDLITRYKNLIPSLEITMVKTDTLSKCYTYRREVREVCTLLRKVRDQTRNEPQPENLENVNQLIKHQEHAITQLDLQRPNIISMIQKGKELVKDVHAPPFIQEEVKSLESGWNETFEETIEALRKLKTTQSIWTNYTDQKNEILELLARADRELKKLSPGQYNSSNIPAELQAKQEMSIQLREATEEMLRKLRDLCRTLGETTAPDNHTELEKEVSEIEERLHTTIENVQEQVVYLQKCSSQWTQFHNQLGDLQTWAIQNAPQLLSAVHEDVLAPEERVTKTTTLQSELHQKITMLNQLQRAADELCPEDVTDNPEAQKMRVEVGALQQKIANINQNAAKHANAVERDLQTWKEVQNHLVAIKPWIEESEVKINMGIPKPATIEEAIQLQNNVKGFGKECQLQFDKLQGISLITREMVTKTSAPDELDALHTRWTIINDTANQWGNKLDKLVTNWQELDKNIHKLETWIINGQKVVAEKSFDLSTPNIDKLEKELAKLKMFNNEISEQQAKLITLTQAADSISHSLAPEGQAVVKSKVQELKGEVNKLADAVRAKINQVSDAILSKHEFQTKIGDFANWMDHLNSNMVQIDEVRADKVDVALINIHAMLQEHSDKQPAFSAIYDEVKSMTASGSPKDNEALADEYTNLVKHYQYIEHELQEKKTTLQRWSELLNWHGDTDQQLSHVKYRVNNQKLNQQELQPLITEIDNIIGNLATWKSNAPLVDKAQYITILDKNTNLPTTAESLVKDIESKSGNLKSLLLEKVSSLQKLQSNWAAFDDLQKKINAELQDTQDKLETIAEKVKKPADVEVALIEINTLLDQQPDRHKMRDELIRHAHSLMKEDLQNVSLIQTIISTTESNWDRVQDEIKQNKLKYSDIIYAWKEFQESKDVIEKEIGRISQICDDNEVPNDLIQANINNEKAKKTMEALKKTKAILDKLDIKGENIARKCDFSPNIAPEVKKELQEVHNHWSQTYEKILKLVQVTESQVIIWKNLEETKNKLLQWLNEQNSAMISAAEKPNEIELARAKLTKYKEELPGYLSLKQSIPKKYEQLIKLSQVNEIPTLESCVKLFDDQFEEVNKNVQKLEQLTSVFGDKEKSVRNDIKEVANQISGLREEIIKCEDLSGDNVKVLERLLKCQSLKDALGKCDVNIRNIDQQIQQMITTYPSFSESTVPKEAQNLKKRYDTIHALACKIESTLLSFLKKCHNEKFAALQRIIAVQKEKINWCLPEGNSDKYNLEVKLNSLTPVESAIEDCETRKVDLEKSLEILENVENHENVKLLTAEKDHLVLELNDLKQNYETTKNQLLEHINVIQKYDQLSDAISNWLKDMENKVRTQTVTQLDLNKVPEKIEETTKLQKEVHDYEKQIKELSDLNDTISKETPDARSTQFVQHLRTRYSAINKFLSHYLDKLRELNKYKDLYKNSIKDVEDWLVQAEEKVKSYSELASSGAKPNQAMLEELRKFASEREKGQLLLNKAVEHGEALFSGITPENRDTIRTELRTLRDKSEALIDKVNKIYKQVETIIMQRHSFEDSLTQVKTWIADVETKLLDKPELDATLAEKKQTLQNYKSLAQDVNLHKNILSQLKQKIEELGDSEAASNLNENVKNYNKLAQDVSSRVNTADKYVSDHETYIQAIEKCRDWLTALTAEAALLVDEMSSETADAKLNIVENLLGQKVEGDKILENCKKQLQVVLGQTAQRGHPPLIEAFNEQENAWNGFLNSCSEAQSKLHELHSQYAHFGSIVNNLETWLKQKENQVKDKSLRSTHEAKQAHLDKLKQVETEITTKSNEFDEVNNLAKKVEVDSELNAKVSQLTTRYQSLKNAAKENINRYEGFVKEHKGFDVDHANFVNWLSEQTAKLQELSHIVGDVAVLQQRQADVKQMIDVRNQKSEVFENLIARGEKLYAHTSPDGREIIRQQLRNLRTMWDTFTDDLQNASNRLEQCLLQFNDFSATQEQLTKWLKDVEKAMQQHTELKATLQEKRAQLQNHKIMHQEIMSHQQLVAAVCDKAQQLVDQTQDKSLNIYLQSIKQLYQNIVAKSDDLLNNLEDCVEKHNQLNVKISGFKDWLSGETDKIQEKHDVSGEKFDIVKRIESLKQLRDNEKEGHALLDQIKKQMVEVAKSTAPKGVEQLKKEVDGLYSHLKQHLKDIG